MTWIDKDDHIECPNCGRWWEKDRNETYRFNHCPCCGADLEDKTKLADMSADRKTEPFDKDINVRSKTEPQTE